MGIPFVIFHHNFHYEHVTVHSQYMCASVVGALCDGMLDRGGGASLSPSSSLSTVCE